MRSVIGCLGALLFGLILATGSQAATTHYANPSTGDDSRSCTTATSPSTPKRSVCGASGLISCLSAGETGQLAAGNYTGEDCGNISTNGTASQPITLQGAVPLWSAMTDQGWPDESTAVALGSYARIVLANQGAGLLFNSGDKYWTVKDLELDGSATTTGGNQFNLVRLGTASTNARHVTLDGMRIKQSYNASCITLFNDRLISPMTSGFVLRRSVIENCGALGPFSSQIHGVYHRGNGSVIEYNIFKDMTRGRGLSLHTTANPATADINSHSIVRYNLFDTIAKQAVHITDGTNIRAYGNVVTNSKSGIEHGSNCKQCLVYSNTLDGSGEAGGVGLLLSLGGTGIAANNIALRFATQITDASSGGITLRNNLSTGTATDVWETPGTDYTPENSPASVAIDAGTASVCTTADINARRCTTPKAVLTGFSGAAPDQGAIEVGGGTPSQVVGSWLVNNSDEDASDQNNDLTLTNATYTTSNPKEGSHALLFNATNDVAMIDTFTGWRTDASGFGIGMWVRPSGFTGTQYGFGCSDVDAWANRIQIKFDGDGDIWLGLGGSSNVVANISGARLSTATDYYVALALDGNGDGTGTYRLYLGADGADLDEIASGSYAGLSAFGACAIGNNGRTNTEGFAGNIDAIKVWNYAPTATEFVTECELNGTCTAPPPPTFDALNVASCNLEASGLLILATLTGTPDPNECLNVDNILPKFGGVEQTEATCSISGSVMTLTLSVSPDTSSPDVDLTIVSPSETVQCTESFTLPATPVADLSQAGFWVSLHPETSDRPWLGAENSTPRVPRNQTFHVRTLIANEGAATTGEITTSFFCTGNGVATPTRVTQDCTTDLRLCFDVVASGVDIGATIDTNVLTLPGGVDFVACGTLRNSDTQDHSCELQPDKATEHEWRLKFGTVASEVTYTCEVTLKDGQALSAGTAATFTTAPPRGRVY